MVLQILKHGKVFFKDTSLSNIIMKPEVPSGWERYENCNLGSKPPRLSYDHNTFLSVSKRFPHG